MHGGVCGHDDGGDVLDGRVSTMWMCGHDGCDTRGDTVAFLQQAELGDGFLQHDGVDGHWGVGGVGHTRTGFGLGGGHFGFAGGHGLEVTRRGGQGGVGGVGGHVGFGGHGFGGHGFGGHGLDFGA